jgi:repressor LexA
VKMTEKLDLEMKRMKINRKELSRLTGIPYTTIINFYKQGTDNIKLSTSMKLAEFFNVGLDYLLNDKNDKRSEYRGVVPVPIIGKISCGRGMLSEAEKEVEGYEHVPSDWVAGAEHFIIRAKGDSMSGARILDGDMLLIREQNTVENGEIAAVCIDGEVFLKRVFIHNKSMILQSENPAYPPIIANGESDIRIIGKLKKIIIHV